MGTPKDRGDGGALASLGSRAVDPYEAKYMPGEGLVLYRAKARAPWQFAALFALVFAVAVGQAAVGAWLVGGAAAVLTALAYVVLSVLRVTVSERAVNIQYGLFGLKIPMAAIEGAQAVRYRWQDYGGWGIRMKLGRREVLYNMPGDQGWAVRIRWRDAKGKLRTTLVGSRDAVELAQAIADARQALAPAGGVRALKG